jgi:death-on-curing protein
VKEPTWLRKDFIISLHEELLTEFGGSADIRDAGLLESALGRPLNLFSYAKPNLFELAASYAHGIISNHPFVDGNKRTGFMAAYTFLGLNGFELQAPEPEATAATLALAARELTEQEYAKWLKQQSKRRKV